MSLLNDLKLDIDDIYSTDFGFGVTVSTSGDDVIGIFEDEYFTLTGNIADIESSQPRLRVRNVDLTNLSVSSLCTVNSQEYVVKRHLPYKKTGETILILEENTTIAVP